MTELYDALPNFGPALDEVRRNLAHSQDSRDHLAISPMLLLGPPGVGKTHFAHQIARLLGTGMTLVPMSSMTAGWLLSGSSSQWKGSRPGKVFEAIVDGQYANPVIVVDEVDKASNDAQYDPLGALYRSIRAEHDWGRRFAPEPVDEVLERLVDMPPREMRRAWMTAFGNARLEDRDEVKVEDLPSAGGGRSRIGFLG